MDAKYEECEEADDELLGERIDALTEKVTALAGRVRALQQHQRGH